jgi:hypothetical protein
MTEQEFRSHVADVNRGDDPIDQLLHFAKVATNLLNMIAGSAFLMGKPPFPPEAVDPWAERKPKANPDAGMGEAEYQAAIERRVRENQESLIRE